MVQSSTKKSSEVPEQFYGYSIQLPRMAVHLFDADVDTSVCLEHIDDIATLGPAGEAELEQSKSSFTDNPIADRALAFWKTLSNWVDVARQKRIDVQKTRFRLHVAQTRECGPLIARLRDATSESDALAAITAVMEEFWGAAPAYPLRAKVPATLINYIDNVLGAPRDLLAAIIQRFGVDVGTGNSIDDVRRRARKQLVSVDQVDDLVKHALGWLQERVHEMIEARDVVIIAREEFFAAMRAYVRKYDRILQLAPWAQEPSPEIIDKELQHRQYVRQLDLIEMEADDKIRAAADYLKSIVDRTQWSVRGDVDPSSFKQFEDNLHQQWRARSDEISVTHEQLGDVSRGRLLYARCLQYQAKLQGLEPTHYFTPGCFHSLADVLKVGWHPQFQGQLSAKARKKDS